MRFIGINMRFLFLFIIGFSFQTAIATTPDESTEAFKAAVRSYSSAAGAQSLLFQGSEQMKYPLHYLSDPYFIADEYSLSEIWYSNTYYTEVLMRLDMYRNELIVSSDQSPFNIVIDPLKFDSAQLHGQRIKFLPQLQNFNKTYGSYCVCLHDGSVKLYMRPEAPFREIKQNREISYRFERSDSYFIEKAGELYPVDNIRQFYKVFPEQKAQIKAFIRDRHYKFKKNPSVTMVEILKNLPLE